MNARQLRPERLVADGFSFLEGPRWREGRLYCSDMGAGRVVRIDPATGAAETLAAVAERPSGLGWLPDGRLLVVSMGDRRLLRLERDGRLALHADLSDLVSHWCNDMVVDDAGRAYAGNFGYDALSGEVQKSTCLVAVEP